MNWATIVGKISGTIDQHLVHRYEYVLAENRVLRSQVPGKVRFTDAQRISLATAAKPIGRQLLDDLATLVTPDTLLRWHRRLVENKTPVSRGKLGRPATDADIVELVLRLARVC